jgi:hypothetical protein
VFISVVLFIFVLITRFIATLAYPIEVGIDGAYYTINVTSLLTEGILYYDAPILSFAVAALFSLGLGGNVIVGVKLTSAFFASVLTVGMFYTGYTLSDGDPRVGLIAGLLTAFDVFLFHAATSLVKNEAALAFFPFAIAFLYRFSSKGHNAGDFAGFLIMGILTVLSHLITVAWLFAAVIACIGYESLKRLKEKQHYTEIGRFVAPIALSGVFFLGLYVLFDFLIPAGDTWYTSSSLLKAANYSTSLDTMQAVLDFFGFAQTSTPSTLVVFDWLYSLYVILIVVLTALGAFFLLKRNRIGDRLVLLLFITNMLIGFIMGSWFVRFLMMNFIPLYLILGLSLIPIMDKIATGLNYSFRRISLRPRSNLHYLLTILIILGLLALAIPNFYYVASTKIHPHVTPEELQSIESLEGRFPENSLLYAPQGINYFVTSRTGYEARPDWGYSAQPVYCARKMYYNLRINGRPSYFVLMTDNSPFFQNTLANQHARIEGLTNFDLIKNELQLTVVTEQSSDNLFCSLRHIDHDKVDLSYTLAESRSKTWTASLSLEALADGLYIVYIAPNRISVSNPNTQKCWIVFYIYHLSTLPEPHVSVDDLVFEAETAGTIHVMGVNLTTATRINLLQLNLYRTNQNDDQTYPELFMIALTPFYFIPYKQFLASTFVLILLLCPLNAIYLLGLIQALGWLFNRISFKIPKIYLLQSRFANPVFVTPHPQAVPVHQAVV